MGVMGGVLSNSGGAIDFSTTVILAPTSSSRNIIQATTTGIVPLTIKLASSSTSNLQEWQNSSGTVLTQINYNGDIVWGNRTGYIGGATWGLTFSYSSGYLYGSFNFGKYKFSNIMTVSQQIGWSTDALNTSADVAIDRSAAGILKVTDGSTGNGSLIVGAYSSSTIALTVKAAASQSANLQEWQNSSGTVLTRITAAGRIDIMNAAGSSAIGSWYNNGDISTFYTSIYNVNSDGRTNINATNGFTCDPTFPIKWTATNFGAADCGLIRNGTGQIRITDGSTGLGSLICGAYSASTIALTVKAASSQTANLNEWQDSSSNVLTRIDKNGTLVTKVNSAPTDGDLAANECAMWFDSINGNTHVRFKGKSADGTVLTGDVKLS